MLRLLLLVPLIVVPPVLTAGYFLYVEPALATPAASPVVDDPSREALTAYEKANRLLTEARRSEGDRKAELLNRAAVQYRVCLAYETAVEDARPLFADARHNLEASRLLLIQDERVQLAQAPPPERKPASPPPLSERKPVPPAPVVQTAAQPLATPKITPKPTVKPEPKPAESVSPPPQQEPKPVPRPSKPTKKILTVGPDGVIYERIEK